MDNSNWFYLLRNIAFIFAFLMLVKYTVYLLIAPLYPIKEAFRTIKNERKRLKGEYIEHKISVIIPTYNEEVGIVKTVRSVVQNEYQNFEIIVVNDGSTDQTEYRLKNYLEDLRNKNSQLFTNVRYYKKEKGGKGSALNFGIGRAEGDVILTVDADSILKKDALKRINPYFNDSNINAVVGNVIIANPHNLISFIQYLEYQFGFYFKRSHAFMGAEYIFGGACAAFRKNIFERVGNFDTKSRTEDIEMSLRIRAFGYKCTYAEDVICYTEAPSSLLGLINQRLRWKKGRVDAFWKYRNLFFSRANHHNKLLTFFVLPFSLLSELQLLFEPLAITLLLAYSYISNDYLSLSLGVMFIFIIYIVNSFFTYRGLKPHFLIVFPFTWPFFYLLVWVEYLALIETIRLTLNGKEIEWQKWKREGITA